MTAHPQPRRRGDTVTARVSPPPSESGSSVAGDDADPDLALSISSSDLDASWLEVRPRRAPGSGSSALGSSTISELGRSSNEPSEVASDDGQEPWALSSDGGSERPAETDTDDADPDDASVDLETPLLGSLDDTASAFQRSFIFPDPNSASASFMTGASASTVMNTPSHSLANIRSVPNTEPTRGSTLWEPVVDGKPLLEEHEDNNDDKGAGKDTDFKSEGGSSRETKATKAGISITKAETSNPSTTANVADVGTSFRPHSAHPNPPVRRGSWSMMFVVFGIFLVLELGPMRFAELVTDALSPALRGLGLQVPVAIPDVAPAPPPTPPPVETAVPTESSVNWIRTPNLSIVLHALSALSAETPKPIEAPTNAPNMPATVKEPSATELKMNRISKTYHWSRNKVGELAVPEPKDLAVTASAEETEKPSESPTPHADSAVAENLARSLILMSDYITWGLDIVTALTSHVYTAIRDEVEFDYQQLRAASAMAYDLFQQGQVQVLGIINDAAARLRASPTSPDAGESIQQQVHNLACANGRCDRVVQAAVDFQARGYATLRQARRGLDNALRAASDFLEYIEDDGTDASFSSYLRAEEHAQDVETQRLKTKKKGCSGWGKHEHRRAKNEPLKKHAQHRKKPCGGGLGLFAHGCGARRAA
ncbi:hypothetical protein Q8F55_007877 [Vanrija albida]|uniref:Uncharacterized protein n=1 Tax=Vanrija albida TaxID=181172 RepID=A0ABR3PVR1_9TREE